MRGEEDSAPLGGRLAHELLERPLHERIEAGRRLVEHDELGAADERLHSSTFCLFPTQARIGRSRSSSNLAASSRAWAWSRPPQRAEVREQLGADQALVERELAR